MHRLLLAEDDPHALRILAGFLIEEGFEVMVAPDGGAALDLLKSERFSLLITDLDMPRATGLDLLAYVRQEGLDLPVIIITASSDTDARAQADAMGAADYLNKPIMLDALLERISRQLEGR